MRIDVDSLKNSIDIVEVVNQYVELDKVGTYSHRASCPHPAHDDKTPSFYVKSDKQFFKCFGCNFKGDVITFIEEMENVDFLEAVEILINNSELEINEVKSTKTVIQEDISLEQINKALNMYNRQNSINEDILDKYDNPPKYFAEQGFSKDTLDYFEVGYCGDSNDRLYRRATIPWRDEKGNLVTINARATFDDYDNKYIFKKGSNKNGVLYNLNNLERDLDKPIIITEGEKDVWRLHEFGYHRAVAIGGGGKIGDRKWLLREYTTEAILALDPDEAGKKATKEITKELYPLMDVYTVKIPNDTDIGDIRDQELMDDIMQNTIKFKGGHDTAFIL